MINDPKIGNTITYDYYFNKPTYINNTTYVYNGKGELSYKGRLWDNGFDENHYDWDESGNIINQTTQYSTQENEEGYVINNYGNIVGINGVIARYVNGEATFLMKDAHGNVIYTQKDFDIIKYYDYDAFGNEKDADSTDKNPYRYCGEYYDVNSNMYYLRNRYYNPRIGRFTSIDPVKDGNNWYVYCGNNPVNFVDPFGLEYGKLRDFVNDYYGAFGGNVRIETTRGLNFAYITMGNYERAFYFDGTIIERNFDNSSGQLLSETSIKIADNIDGSLYLQRSAFVAAMGMTKDGTATIRTSEPIYVSSALAMLDFATNINDSISVGSDVKDIHDVLGKAPIVGKVIRNGISFYDMLNKLKNGSILSTGNYRAEKVTVYSPANDLYSYEVNSLYGIDEGTSYYQWFEKRAHFGAFWDTIN